jgi:hypothetical protein
VAEETEPSSAQAKQTDKRIVHRMANLSPWGSMHHATKHVNAAVTFAQKLSQARDLQDRARIHAEHMKTHIDLFNERARELSDAMAAAGNLVGAVVSHLHWHTRLNEMARNSPTYKQTGEEGQKRTWSPEPKAKKRDR